MDSSLNHIKFVSSSYSHNTCDCSRVNERESERELEENMSECFESQCEEGLSKYDPQTRRHLEEYWWIWLPKNLNVCIEKKENYNQVYLWFPKGNTKKIFKVTRNRRNAQMLR